MKSLGDQVLRARLQLMLRFPFLSSAVARLPIVEVSRDSWITTAATDGYHIFWNPTFFETISEEEMAGVVAHEVLHAVLGHVDRRGAREADQWNIAADHAANLLLLAHGISLPDPHLADPQFNNMTVEEIYGEVRKPPRPVMSAVKAKRILGRIGKSTSRKSRAPGRATVTSARFDLHIDPSDARLGTLSDIKRPTPLELDRIRHELQKEALAELAKIDRRGDLSGEWAEAIKRAGKPQTPWQALLARCFTGVRRDDFRYFPPAKRHIWRGIYLPSIGVPGPNLIVCAIDTSGSISTALAQRFLSELHGLRSTAKCQLFVVQCDAAIQNVHVYESWEEPDKSTLATEFVGRGGTNFVPVFDLIKSEIAPRNGAPDLVVYLTDGDGRFPEEAPNYPVVWIMPERADTTPPFGLTIRLPDSVEMPA